MTSTRNSLITHYMWNYLRRTKPSPHREKTIVMTSGIKRIMAVITREVRVRPVLMATEEQKKREQFYDCCLKRLLLCYENEWGFANLEGEQQ